MRTSNTRWRVGRAAVALVLLAAPRSAPAQGICDAIDGGAPLGHLGQSVALAADLDGDGHPELVAGSPRETSGAVVNGGAVRVYSGVDRALRYEWKGPDATGELGFSVAGVGDLDLDGVPDLVAGAPFADVGLVDAGVVRAWSGATGAPLWSASGPHAFGLLGYSVSGADDLDHDGRADVFVGAPQKGRAALLSGQTGAEFASVSGAVLWFFGTAVASGGDANQDGVADLLVAAPFEVVNSQKTGTVRLYSGADLSTLATLSSPTSPGNLGDACAWIGDVDGDGVADIAAHGRSSALGVSPVVPYACHVFSGSSGALVRSHTGSAPAVGDDLGFAIADVGDVDLDGVSDYALGSPNHLAAGAGGGAVQVFSGASGASLVTFSGAGGLDQFGFALCPAGDPNQDGFGDLIVGAPLDDDGAQNGGRVFLVSMVAVPAIPVPISPGTKVFGTLTPGGKDLLVTFPVLGSGALKLRIEGLTGGLASSTVEIIDPGGNVKQQWALWPWQQKVKLPLYAAGEYALRVRPAVGAAGTFSIGTGIKLPPEAKDRKLTLTGTTAYLVPVAGFPGSTASVKLKVKGGDAGALTLRWFGPDGAEIDVADAITAGAGGKLYLGGAPMSSPGTHVLRVDGVPSPSVKVKVKIDVSHPAAPATVTIPP